MAMARNLWFPPLIPESMRGLPRACTYSALLATQPFASSGGPGTFSETVGLEALNGQEPRRPAAKDIEQERKV